jgi:transcription elongation factor Elf1
MWENGTLPERRNAMKCPVCKHRNFKSTDLHADGFDEALCKCAVCGSTWSINHGLTEVVKDTQENSFLAGITECVEGDDYGFAV